MDIAEAFVKLRPNVEGFESDASEHVLGIVEGLAGHIHEILGAALVVGVAAGLEHIGDEFVSAFEDIRVETGKTGEALDGLEEDFKNVAKGVASPLGDVGVAIGGLAQRLNETGSPLENLATNILNLSRITHTDLNTNVQASAELFNNWGISVQDQVPKLDELFRASQGSGVSVAALASAMSQAGPILRQVGLNFEQSAAFVALLGKAGVDAGSVMPALSRAIANAAAAGKSATDVFNDVFDAIKNAPSDTEAAGAAIDVFGARAGPRLAGLVRQGQVSYEEFAAAIANGSDTIEKATEDTLNWHTQLEILKNRALVALEPVATRVFEGINVGITKVTAAVAYMVPGVQAAAHAFIQAFSGEGITSDGLVGVIERVGVTARSAYLFVVNTVIPGIKQAIASLVSGFQGTGGEGSFFTDLGEAARKVYDFFQGSVVPFWQGTLIPAFHNLGDYIQGHLKPILIGLSVAAGLVLSPLLTASVGFIVMYQRSETFRNGVAATIAFLQTKVAPVVAQVVGYIVGQFTTLVNAVRDRWAAISEAIGHVLQFIKVAIAVQLAPILLAWKLFHDQILAVLKAAWETVKTLVNQAVRAIRDVIDIVLDLINGDWGKAWDALKDLLGAVWNDIVAELKFGLEALQQLLSAALTALGALWGVAWDAIKAVAGAAWDWIYGKISDVVGAVVNTVQSVLGTITGIVSGIWNAVTSATSIAWDTLKTTVSTTIDTIVGFITGWPGRMASAASGLWDWFWEGLTFAVNTVIRLINGAIDLLDAFQIHVHINPPAPLPGINFDWNGLQIPEIPYLHTGGVVPGRPGQEVLAMLMAGETVTPAGTSLPVGTSPPSVVWNGDAYITDNSNEPAGDTIARELRRLQLMAGW